MRKTRVLIVDDDAVVRLAVLNSFADDPNTEVSASSSGQDVLNRLAGGEQIDRLLVDWNMPGLNGIELVRKVRADPRFSGMRILMVTSETLIECVALALAVGADDYLMKPFTKEMLLGKLALLEVDCHE
ncbi:MAG TPA: response regulator [Verrucomicrobiae bacterium]|nr:response regulator [Verrucomicrobiae bacterium]